jgi:glutathione peroxidase
MELMEKYGEDGFEVLIFPCVQFSSLRPPKRVELRAFIEQNYPDLENVKIFSLVDVNGPSSHPLYAFLKSRIPGWFGNPEIYFNFTKVLMFPLEVLLSMISFFSVFN